MCVHPRRGLSSGTCKRDGRCDLREDRIGQHVDAGMLNQHGGVADPGHPGVVGLLARGDQSGRRRRDCAIAVSVVVGPGILTEEPPFQELKDASVGLFHVGVGETPAVGMMLRRIGHRLASASQRTDQDGPSRGGSELQHRSSVTPRQFEDHNLIRIADIAYKTGSR